MSDFRLHATALYCLSICRDNAPWNSFGQCPNMLDNRHDIPNITSPTKMPTENIDVARACLSLVDCGAPGFARAVDR